MTLAIARRTAASLPGQVGSHSSAIEAVFERRGSMTATRQPRIFASMIRCACGLK